MYLQGIVLITAFIPIILYFWLEKKDKSTANYKSLVSFLNITISAFTSLILCKSFLIIGKYFSHKTEIPAIFEYSLTSFDYIGFTITFLGIISFVATLLLLVNFIKNNVFSTLTFSIVLILLIMLVITMKYDINNDTHFKSIILILSYLCSLLFNYILLKQSTNYVLKLYNWLITSKEKESPQLDLSKLTFLWTSIVFILGILFNIKK